MLYIVKAAYIMSLNKSTNKLHFFSEDSGLFDYDTMWLATFRRNVLPP